MNEMIFDCHPRGPGACPSWGGGRHPSRPFQPKPAWSAATDAPLILTPAQRVSRIGTETDVPAARQLQADWRVRPNCRVWPSLRPWWRSLGRRRWLLAHCRRYGGGKRSDGSSEQQITPTFRACDHDDPPFWRPFLRRRSHRRLIPKVERRRAGHPCLLVSNFYPSSAITSCELTLMVCTGCAARPRSMLPSANADHWTDRSNSR